MRRVFRDNKTGVYEIRCLISGRRYIGSAARSIGSRWYTHRRELNNRTHGNIQLQRAWDKHGAGAFIFSVLRYCSPDNCLLYEQDFIETAVENGEILYNIYLEAGSPLGTKRTKEYKRMMSLALRGRKFSAEHRENLRKASTGQKFSLMRRLNISRALKGKKLSAETRRKMSIAGKGRPKSAKHREKIRLALIGKKKSPSHIAALRLAAAKRKELCRQ